MQGEGGRPPPLVPLGAIFEFSGANKNSTHTPTHPPSFIHRLAVSPLNISHELGPLFGTPPLPPAGSAPEWGHGVQRDREREREREIKGGTR